MHFLLTNDDGIDAEGLAALKEAVGELVDRITVVAPASAMSECSHQASTREPIRVETRGEGSHAIHGTPADCVRLAVLEICKIDRPDWVLSGINHGGNLGVDIYLSGTVAAAREAAIFGVPAIALSHYFKRGVQADWAMVSGWTRNIVSELINQSLEPNSFWNVNYPHLDPNSPQPESVHCQPSQQPLPVSYKQEGEHFQYSGVYAEREREEGSDIDHCFNGRVAISKLNL